MVFDFDAPLFELPTAIIMNGKIPFQRSEAGLWKTRTLLALYTAINSLYACLLLAISVHYSRPIKITWPAFLLFLWGFAWLCLSTIFSARAVIQFAKAEKWAQSAAFFMLGALVFSPVLPVLFIPSTIRNVWAVSINEQLYYGLLSLIAILYMFVMAHLLFIARSLHAARQLRQFDSSE